MIHHSILFELKHDKCSLNVKNLFFLPCLLFFDKSKQYNRLERNATAATVDIVITTIIFAFNPVYALDKNFEI